MGEDVIHGSQLCRDRNRLLNSLDKSSRPSPSEILRICKGGAAASSEFFLDLSLVHFIGRYLKDGGHQLWVVIDGFFALIEYLTYC